MSCSPGPALRVVTVAAVREAAQLTEAYRLEQLRLGATTAAQLRDAWQLIDLEAIDATLGRYLRVAVPLVRAQGQRSAELGARYIGAFRGLELGTVLGFDPVIAPAPAVEAVTTSLTVTGPARVKSAMSRGVPLARAGELGQSGTMGSGMRQALDAGRGSVTASVDADERALGWARATSGKSCGFCAMLASRGPVYKGRDTGGFKPHDRCSCVPEPVYRPDAPWPAGSERYAQLWDETTRGLGGDDAIAAFRAAVES